MSRLDRNKDNNTNTKTGYRTAQKPLVQLEVDDEGYPEIPEAWEGLKLADKKELIRSMLTLSYHMNLELINSVQS